MNDSENNGGSLESASSGGNASGLQRRLGAGIAMAVVVGSVIGAGIFYKPGNIAAEAGNFRVIIGVWIFGGLLCLLGALCFAELATMFPQAGGLYVYLREAYGRPIAFLYGWSEFLFGKPAAIGALAVAFIGSLALALNWKMSPVMELVLVAALIGGLAWINILGVLWGGRLQMVVTCVKAGFLALMAALPFLMSLFGERVVDMANYASTITPRQPTLGTQIGAVLLAVMWAYHGWHAITPLAEEVRDPQRNIPLALFGGIGVLMVLYVSANIAYHAVLPMPEMASAGNHAAEVMLQTLLGPRGGAAMSAVILCSTFGAINSNLLEAPRVTFAMGRDGVFFRSLGSVHANYHTPAAAIMVTAAISMGTVLIATIAKWYVAEIDVTQFSSELNQRVVKSLQTGSIFDLLTNCVVFATSVFFTLGVVAIFILRSTQPGRERPYKTLGYPVVPALFLLINGWFLWEVYQSKPLESGVGIALILLGLPVYVAYQRFAARGKTT